MQWAVLQSLEHTKHPSLIVAKHSMNTHHLAGCVPQAKTPASHNLETTTLRA